MKKLGYYLFAIMFYIGRLFPVNSKKVFCIMTHDASKDSSVGVIIQSLKDLEENFQFIILSKNEKKLSNIFSFFLMKPFHLATSKYVMLDNIFLPMAYLRFRSDVKVVQLWHGRSEERRVGKEC